MFSGERIHDTIQTSFRPQDAARWFGTAPPDLTLIARSRGTDYLYTFLKSFSTECLSLNTMLAVIGQIEVMRCLAARTWGPRKAGRG